MTKNSLLAVVCGISMAFGSLAFAGKTMVGGKVTHILKCGALPGLLGASFDLEVVTQALAPQHAVRECTLIRRAGNVEALRVPLSIREDAVELTTKFRSESEDGEMYSAVVKLGENLSAFLEIGNAVLQCQAEQ